MVQIEVSMIRRFSTAERLHGIAERTHDVAARFARSDPAVATGQLIGEIEGATVDLRVVVGGRS